MPQTSMELSSDAVHILNGMPYDAEASNCYEHLSRGFVWSDEFSETRSADWTVVAHEDVNRCYDKMFDEN